MKFHKQRFEHKPEEGSIGDCHRTAIACILDLDPEDIPHIDVSTWNDPKAFQNHFVKELKKLGYGYFDVAYQSELHAILDFIGAINPDTYYLIGGTSSRGFGHTVVGLNNKIIHDPSPLGGEPIVGPMPDGYYWITVLVPIQFKANQNQNHD